MVRASRTSVFTAVFITGLVLAFTASGQQNKESSLWDKAAQDLSQDNQDRYPTFIKGYSKDGKQSLTGDCKAKDPDTGKTEFRPRDPSKVSEITCTLISVRYMIPDERPKQTSLPSTYEEYVKQAVRDNPRFAEELRRNPKKARDEWNKLTDRLCSKEHIAGLQKQMPEIQMGPKLKGHYQTLIDACLTKDFKSLIDNVNSQDSRTCSIWVETFKLDFKRIGKGKWLTGSEPQGLCNVVSIYELEVFGGIGMADTVKNTVVTVGGTRSGMPEFPKGICKAIREDTKEPMVWSLTNNNLFEPSCDFIKHDYISAPFPYELK